MYKDLIMRLREAPNDWPDADLHYEAADAIEELSSQLEDFKRLCLSLKENRLYKFADGSFTEVTLMIVPREPTEPPKEET